jgi:hypothetical protein
MKQKVTAKTLAETLAAKCRWFLLCPNKATTVVHHPTLGDVPTCARCAERVANSYR